MRPSDIRKQVVDNAVRILKQRFEKSDVNVYRGSEATQFQAPAVMVYMSSDSFDAESRQWTGELAVDVAAASGHDDIYSEVSGAFFKNDTLLGACDYVDYLSWELEDIDLEEGLPIESALWTVSKTTARRIV